MTQEVGSLQLLNIQKHLQTFVNMWPDTVDWPYNWCWINSPLTGKWFMRFFFQIWERGSSVWNFFLVVIQFSKGNHNVWRLHIDLSDISTLYELHPRWKRVLCSQHWGAESLVCRSLGPKLLFTFVYKQRVIHKEFMPERKTVNNEFCMQVLEGLLKWILKVRLAVLRERQFIRTT